MNQVADCPYPLNLSITEVKPHSMLAEASEKCVQEETEDNQDVRRGNSGNGPGHHESDHPPEAYPPTVNASKGVTAYFLSTIWTCS